MNPLRLSRRTALLGSGTLIGLPLLDAMLNDKGRTFRSARAAEAAPPTRLLVWAFGNGTRMPAWEPTVGEGALTSASLSPALEPLGLKGGTDLTRHLTVVTGLDHKQTVLAGAHDGVFIASGGPNVQSNLSSFPLPGGPSIDTVLADRLGGTTKLKSLPISNDKDELINWCILSWSQNGSPIQPYRSTQTLFDKLFAGAGGSGEAKLRRELYDRSVLDFVKADASALLPRLGSVDRKKVEEHLDAVRQVEKQIGSVANCSAGMAAAAATDDFVKRGRLFADLLVLALKCDLTRYGTFMYQNSDGNQQWPGMTWQDHTASHDAGDDVILEITRNKMVEFKYLIEKMANVVEGAGTLLDHSLVLCSSEIGDGGSHDVANLPVLLAGHGGGLPGGRLIKRPGANYNDMLCSLMNYAGAQHGPYGVAGTGPLAGL